MNRYQIKVRDPDGEPLGSVEFDAKTPEAAVEQARLQLERAEEDEPGFPADSEYEPEKLDAVTLWTIEDEDGNVREIEAKSKKAAEKFGTAVAKRQVYFDSIVPVVNQAGPTPLS